MRLSKLQKLNFSAIGKCAMVFVPHLAIGKCIKGGVLLTPLRHLSNAGKTVFAQFTKVRSMVFIMAFTSENERRRSNIFYFATRN